MNEIDPKTGLQENDKDYSKDLFSGKPEKRTSPKLEVFQRLKTQGYLDRSPIQGVFGDYGDTTVAKDRDFNEIRARNQSVPELIGKSLMQGASTFVGGTIEAVGFLGDAPQYLGDMITGSEMEFERNIVSQMGKGLQDAAQDAFPIYQTNEAQGDGMSRFTDASFWASMAPSLATTLSLMVPAGGIAMGATKLARFAGAGKGAQQTIATISAALSSRHAENLMESYETHEQVYQNAIGEGLNESEAKEKAAYAASSLYKTGYMNLWQDMAGWGALLRGFKYSKSAVNASIINTAKGSKDTALSQIRRTLIENPTASVKQAVKKAGYDWKDWVLQGGLEGFEEFNQSFMSQHAMKNADIMFGNNPGDAKSFLESYVSGEFIEQLKDPETQNAMVMGVLGGLLFQGAGQLISSKSGRNQLAKEAEHAKVLESQANRLKERLKNIERFTQAGDDVQAQEQFDFMLADLVTTGFVNKDGRVVGSARAGKLTNTIEMFEAVQQMTDSEIEQLGLGDPQSARENANRALQEIEVIEEIYNKNMNKSRGTTVDDIINLYVSEQEYINTIHDRTTSSLRDRINSIKTENKDIEQLYATLNSGQQNYLSDYRELNELRDLKKDLESMDTQSIYKNLPRLKVLQRVRKKSLGKLNERIKDLEERVSEAKGSQGLLKKDIDAAEKVSRDIDKQTELRETEMALLQREYMRDEGDAMLAEMARPQSHKDIEKALKLKDEALIQSVREFSADVKFGDYSFIQKTNEKGEQQLFELHKNEDGSYTGYPVDQDMKKIPDAKPSEFTDLEDLLDTSNKLDISEIITREEAVDRWKEVKRLIGLKDYKGASQIFRDILGNTNYQTFAQDMSTEITNSMSEYIEQENDVKKLEEFLDYIQDMRNPGRTLFMSEMIKKKIQDLENMYQDQLNAIESSITSKTEKLSAITTDLNNVESEINSIRETVEEHRDEVRSLAEQKNKTQKQILRTHRAVRKRLNDAKKKADVRISNLTSTRRKLKKQQSELDKDIRLYTQLRNKIESSSTLPGVVVRESLNRINNKVDAIRTEVLIDFNLTDYGLNKLKNHYQQIIDSIEPMEESLKSFRDVIKDMYRANEEIISLTDEIFEEMIADGLIENEDTPLTPSLYQEYKKRFNKAVTDVISDKYYGQDYTQIRQLINNARITNDTAYNKWIDAVELSEKREHAVKVINEFLPVLEKYKDAVPVYEAVLNQFKHLYTLEKGDSKAVNVKEQDDTFSAPKREVLSVFARSAGNSGSSFEEFSVIPPSQRRFFQFVNKTDIGKGNYYYEVMKATDFDADVLENLPEKYKKKDILVGVLTNEDGEYILSDGSVTQEFNPDTAIYTTLPMADFFSSNMSKTYRLSDEGTVKITESELKQKYPDLSKEARLEKYKEDMEAERQKHQEFRAKIFAQLDEGKTVRRKVYGKSNGVENLIPPIDRSGNPKKISSVFDTDNISLEVVTKEEVTKNGSTYRTSNGSVILHDEITGNWHRVHNRNVSEKEIETIMYALAFMTQRAEITDGRVNTEVPLTDKEGNELLRKDEKGVERKVYAKDILKQFIYAFADGESTIEFVKEGKDKTPGGIVAIRYKNSEEQIRTENRPVYEEVRFPLMKFEDGKPTNKLNPDLARAIKKKLENTIHDVQSNVDSDQKYNMFILEDGFLREKEYDSYKDYILENNVVGTWLDTTKEVDIIDENGDPDTTDPITHWNQNLNYDNSYEGNGVYQEPVSSTETVVDEINPDQIEDGKEYYFVYRDSDSPIIFKVNRGEKTATSALLPDNFDKETSEFAEGVLKLIKKGAYIDKFLNNFRIFTNEKAAKQFVAPSQPETKAEVKEEVKSETSKNEAVDALLNESDKLDNASTQESAKEDLFGDRPFLQKNSDYKELSVKQSNKIIQKLSKKTGIPFNVLAKERAVDLVNRINEELGNDERFTLDNLPKGMYWNGVAYAFGKENITMDTPFHEVSHPIVNQIIADNYELFEELRREVSNSPKGKAIIERVLKTYPNPTVNGEITMGAWAEIITTAIGEEAADAYYGKANQGLRGAISKLWEHIKQFFRNILGTEYVEINNISSDTTIGDIGRALAISEIKFNLTPSVVQQFQRNREIDRSKLPKESVLSNLREELSPGSMTVSNMMRDKSAKLKSPIKIKNGEITHIVFDQEESSVIFTNKDKTFLASYIKNARGNTRWSLSRWNDTSDSYTSVDMDVIKSINKKYGSIRNMFKKAFPELVSDIENFEELGYSKEDKKNIPILMDNSINREATRLQEKYGNEFTFQEFLDLYDERLEKEYGSEQPPKKSYSDLTKEEVDQINRELAEDISDPFTPQITTIFDGKDSAFTKDAMDTMNFYFFGFLANKYPSRMMSLFDGSTETNEFFNTVLADVFKRLNKNKKVLADSIRENRDDPNINQKIELLSNYVYLLKNYNRAVELFSEHLSQYNIETIKDDSDIVKSKETKDSNQLWTTESLKFSSKMNATSSIRLLIGSIGSTNKNASFGTFTNVNFGDMFNILANSLSGTQNLEQMQQRLETYKNTITGMESLFNRVFKKINNLDALTPAEAQLLLEFRQTFAKNYNQYVIAYTSAYNFFSLKNANVNTQKARIVADWNSNISSTSQNFKEEDGMIVYDLDSMRTSGVLSAKTLSLNDRYKPTRKQIESVQNYNSSYESYFKAVNFLKELGIEMTSTTLPDNEFIERVGHIYRSLKNGQQEVSKYNILSDSSNQKENVYKHIVQHEVDTSIEAIENQHYNTEGETVYNVNLYSYVTSQVAKFNNMSSVEEIKTEMPHLASTYSSDSILLNINGREGKAHEFIFDREGNKTDQALEITFADGLINDESSDGVAYDKLEYSDKIRFLFNSLMSNQHALFRPGDNSIERFIGMPDFYDIFGEKYIDQIKQYLVTEFNTVFDLENSGYVNTTQLNDVDYVIEKSPVIGILGKTSKGRSIVSQIMKSKDVNELFNTKNSSAIESILTSYISDEITNVMNFLVQNDILERQGKEFLNNGIKSLSVTNAEKLNETQVRNVAKKFVINSMFGKIEQTKIFTGPLLFYKNADDFFKRMSSAVGTYKTMATGHHENQLIITYFPREKDSSSRLYRDGNGEITDTYSEGSKPVLRSVTYSDPSVVSRVINNLKGDIRDEYKGLNESDAIGFISLDAYRDMKIRASEWTEDQEKLYKWEKSDDKRNIEHIDWETGQIVNLTFEDLYKPNDKRVTFNMYKPLYNGPLAEDGFIPGLYKTALIPILPSYKEYGSILEMNDYMKENNVDLITFESANKIGTTLDENNKLPSAYNVDSDGDATINLDNLPYQHTYYEYWGSQLDTGTDRKYKAPSGSQANALLLSNIYEFGKANPRLEPLAKEITSVKDEMIAKDVESIKQELGLVQQGDGNYTIADIKKLSNFIYSEAARRDVNNNVKDSIKMLEQSMEKMNSDLGLDILSNRDKVENILASIADSRVINKKMHGGVAAQAPATFFEKGVRKYSNNHKQLLSSELDFYEDGTMEVYLPHYFKKIFRDKNIDITNPKLLEGIAFRIPTSGLNSIERIKIKDFLPQSAGDTIILPSEIVAKAGSDYDIDKLNLWLPNYIMNNGNPEYIEYMSPNDKESMEDFAGRVYDNQYGQKRKILNNVIKNFNNIDSWLASAQEKELIPVIADALNYSEVDDVSKFADFIKNKGVDGLEEIRPPLRSAFINANKNKTVEQINSRKALENRYIEIAKEIVSHSDNRSQLLTPIGNDMLKAQQKRLSSEKRRSMTDVIGNFEYNAQVTQRNITSKQLTGVAALHVKDHTYATIYDYKLSKEKFEIPFDHNSDGEFIQLGGKTNKDGKLISEVLNQLLNTAVDGAKDPIFFDLNINFETADVLFYLVRAGVSLNDVFDFLTSPEIKRYTELKQREDSEYMESNFRDDAIINRVIKEFDQSARSLIDQYKSIKEGAAIVNEVIQGTRIDTQAMGKSTSELDLILSSVNSVMNNSPMINANRIYEQGGYLHNRYKALTAFKEMFNPLFITQSDLGFLDSYESILNKIKNKKITSEQKSKILDRAKTHFIAQILLNNPTRLKKKRIPSISSSTDLFTGKNTTAKKLKAYQKQHTDNYLINKLTPIIGKDAYFFNGKNQYIDTIKMFDQRMDTVEQNLLIDSWRKLHDSNPQLSKELIQMSILQSGLELNPMSFHKYIPSELFVEMVHYALEAQNTPLSQSNFVSNVFERNFIISQYRNKTLVPIAKTSRGKTKVPDDAVIYKKFIMKNEFQKQPGETREQQQNRIDEAKAFNVPIFEKIPRIYVNLTKDAKSERPLFSDIGNKGTIEIRPMSIRDFTNNTSITYYGESLQANRITDRTNVQLLDKTTSLKDAYDNNIKCK